MFTRSSCNNAAYMRGNLKNVNTHKIYTIHHLDHMINEPSGIMNVLKFRTIDVCLNSLDKQCRPRSDCFFRSSLIRVFPVCYSDKHFVNSSLEKHFI